MPLRTVPALQSLQEHFLGEILPLWETRALDKDGRSMGCLDRRWMQKKGCHSVLTGQARLLQVILAGYIMEPSPAREKLIEKLISFLQEHFHDPGNEGYVWTVDENNRPKETARNSTGHALLMQAFVMAWQGTGRTDYLDKALALHNLLYEKFADSRGGLVAKTTEDWKPLDENRSQYPMMLWFGAMLELFRALAKSGTGMDHPGLTLSLENRMQKTAELLFAGRDFTGFLLLPEVYTPNWQPLGLKQGGHFRIGHQFLWSWMLLRAVEMDLLPPEYGQTASDLFNSALCCGYGHENGRVLSLIDELGNPLGKGYESTDALEAMHAMMYFIIGGNRISLLPVFHNIYRRALSDFTDRENGGWFVSVDTGGKPLETGKGPSTRSDPELARLCLEGQRLRTCLSREG